MSIVSVIEQWAVLILTLWSTVNDINMRTVESYSYGDEQPTRYVNMTQAFYT